MSLGLFDLLLVGHYGAHWDFPWWVWALGILDALATGNRLQLITKALERAC